MVRDRVELHNLLKEIPGVVKVYYSPPPDIKMDYPCIVYELCDMPSGFADNKPYMTYKKYTVTVIDLEEDSPIADAMVHFPKSSFDRTFVLNGLYHYVYTLSF